MIHALNTFPLEEIQLHRPQMSNGNYVIHVTHKDGPVYVQMPRCVLKSGVSTYFRKFYCDFVYSCDDYAVLDWADKLDILFKEKLLENAEWFDTELDVDDMENFYLSSLKPYRYGKFYVMRAGLSAESSIYNETKQKIERESLKENDSVMAVIEIHGIKCTSKNFSIDFEVRQMLVLSPFKSPFDSLVIKSDSVTGEGLEEVFLTASEDVERVEISSKEEVFKTLCNQAREKAEETKKLALSFFLSRKNITNAHLI